MRGIGVDGNNAVLVGKTIKVGDPRHIGGILISPVQKNDDRIVLLLVVALRQMDDVGARHIIDVDFFLRVLRWQGFFLRIIF